MSQRLYLYFVCLYAHSHKAGQLASPAINGELRARGLAPVPGRLEVE